MKKIALPILFCFLASVTFGQTIKKATNYLDKKDYAKAKSEIDAYLAKKPGDPEGSYYKAKIYQQIADSASNSNLIQGDARQQAFEAFKVAAADSNNMKLKLEMMKDNYSPLFGLYGSYFTLGAEEFNVAAGNQSKDGFRNSMNYFKKANEIGQFIAESEYASIGKVDTTLVLNIGKAALNAGDEKEAERVFKTLAEANITGVANSEDNDTYRIPYQWLTLHYKNAGDESNMIKYAEMGKKNFPDDDYFDFVMMDYYRDKNDMNKVFTGYENLLSRNPDSLQYHFSYANEIFTHIYNADEGTKIENQDQLMETLKNELQKAYALDSDDINTNWLYSQYYYNRGIELRDEAIAVRGTKTEDVNKKADLNKRSKQNFEKAVPFSEKALSKLEASGKKSDKSRYKSIANLMQNIYQSMGDKTNLKKYQDAYDAADTKFTKD